LGTKIILQAVEVARPLLQSFMLVQV